MGDKDEHFMNMKDGRLSGRPGSNKKIGMLDWVNIRRLAFCFFSLTSCHKNISALRARTSFLCLPLSSDSLAHGRCSEIFVEEMNE